MKKILLFPLLDSMPSGHHQVAKTITEYVTNRSQNIECKKIDFMQQWSPEIERALTKTYLWWIKQFPTSYAWIYKMMAYKSNGKSSYKYYEVLFRKKMEKIIAIEKPDLIICTHAFPSYLIDSLKKSGACTVPLINVYTDFFINDVWGRECVDYHFVSNGAMKSALMHDFGISESNIFITGIPITESFSSPSRRQISCKRLNVILSGGSAGLGKITEVLKLSGDESSLNFYVLCGNNKQLFDHLSKVKQNNIHPLPYISSREKMNELYDLADAIVTKPGGVTISEAIKKEVPVFVRSPLPGQEEINLKTLKEQGLVFKVEDEKGLSEQIFQVLSNESKMARYQRSIKRYLDSQDLNTPDEIFHFIKSSIDKRGYIETISG